MEAHRSLLFMKGCSMKEHKGMGFKAAQSMIAKRGGMGMERAGAILAASTRKAGAKARRRNPNLNKVKGGIRKMAARQFYGK